MKSATGIAVIGLIGCLLGYTVGVRNGDDQPTTVSVSPSAPKVKVLSRSVTEAEITAAYEAERRGVVAVVVCPEVRLTVGLHFECRITTADRKDRIVVLQVEDRSGAISILDLRMLGGKGNE